MNLWKSLGGQRGDEGRDTSRPCWWDLAILSVEGGGVLRLSRAGGRQGVRLQRRDVHPQERTFVTGFCSQDVRVSSPNHLCFLPAVTVF